MSSWLTRTARSRPGPASGTTTMAPRSGSPARAVRTSDDYYYARAPDRGARATPQGALPVGDRPGPPRGVRVRQRDADPHADQDRGQHGGRRGGPGRQADRRRAAGPRGDHRAEARGRPGPEVDRPVQAARGHAHRRARDAARRPDVGVLRPLAVAGPAPDP